MEELVAQGPRARRARCWSPSVTLIYTRLAGSTRQVFRDLPKAGEGPASLVPRGRRCSCELLDLWERLVIYCVMETNVFGAREMVQTKKKKKIMLDFNCRRKTGW